MQCNVSDRFLQLSLEYIFGKGTTGTVGGHVLSKNITAVTHAQTAFVHNGRLYILDATAQNPSNQTATSNSAGTYRSRFKNLFNRKPERQAPQALSSTELPELQRTEPADKLEPKAKSAEQRQAELASIQTALETKLHSLFETTAQEALYKRIVSLHAGDPARRTLRIVRQAARGEVTETDLNEMVKYLANYKQASSAALRKMQLPVYDPVIVESLQETIASIVRARS